MDLKLPAIADKLHSISEHFNLIFSSVDSLNNPKIYEEEFCNNFIFRKFANFFCTSNIPLQTNHSANFLSIDKLEYNE